MNGKGAVAPFRKERAGRRSQQHGADGTDNEQIRSFSPRLKI
jgi:hypothetical protein